jgi:hypothetical protein
MNYSGKIMKVVVTGISVFIGLSVAAKDVMSAVSPAVSNLTSVVDGTGTPVRILADGSGNFYVSDNRGGGVLKYDLNGKLLKIYTAVPDAIGMAFAQNGNLLVSHGEAVVRLNPSDGSVLGSFGSFKKAHGIAVDAAGFIYVTDSIDDCVQKFDAAFNPVSVTGGSHSASKPVNSFGTTGLGFGQLKRPAGISYEKVSGQLAVADSLNGRIQFFTTAGGYASSMGTLGGGSVNTTIRFTMPKSIAFEYAGGVVSRYYVVDSYQSNVQVIDAATKTFLDYIGGYGYDQGLLVSPSDVQIDQSNPLTPVLLVANEIGLVTRYGIDSLMPTNVKVLPAVVAGQLSLQWTNPQVPSFQSVNVYQSAVANVLGTKVGSAVAGTSLLSSGLLNNTTYYYTVRGVNNGGQETTNTDQYSGRTLMSYLLTVSKTGTGSNSVISDLQLPGLVESGGVYTASVDSGVKVTLTPNHDAYSVFTGWNGDVCNGQSSGNCVFTMGSAVNVTANFAQQHKFKIAGRGVYDDILQDIYSQALNGETIMAMSGVAPAYDTTSYLFMHADSNVSLTLVGGYDSEYAASSGFTTLQGRVNVKAGKVVFKNIKIKP